MGLVIWNGDGKKDHISVRSEAFAPLDIQHRRGLKNV